MSSSADEESMWQELPLFAPEEAVVPRIAEGESAEHLPGALGALSHLLYDEDSPQEVAEDLRDEGNTLFRHGTRRSYKRAVEKYTEAIKVRCDIPQVAAAAFANRAAAELKLSNFGRALRDAEDALTLEPSNVKCRYRAAVAARSLRKFDIALKHCEEGLECLRLKQQSKTRDATLFRQELKRVNEELGKNMAVERARHLQLEASRKKDSALSRALKARKVKMGLPLFAQQRNYVRKGPDYDAANSEVLWPVLIVYPSVSGGAHAEQSDYLEQVSELATIGDIVETLFPGGCPPPPWDVSGLYSSRPDKLVVRYRTRWTKTREEVDLEDEPDFVGSSLGPEEVGGWVAVSRGQSIAQVLAKSDYIVPLFPVFYVFPQ